MKRLIEQFVAVGIALFIFGAMLFVLILFLGGSLISGLSLVLGFPMAFPMTTGLLAFIGLAFFIFRWKRARKKP